jgi:hypothetical protein
MELPELRAFWSARWGDPPAHRARDHLLRALAYRLQADAQGGLSSRLKREVADLGARFASDRGFNPTAAIVLKPGSSLVREWGGKRHEVAVVTDGYVYDGERFASLSRVANRITGTKWNGLVFFGVKARAAPAAPRKVSAA